MSLLSVSDLSIEYAAPQGFVRAVDRVSFNLEESEVLGIAGESGCGKTTAALSLAEDTAKVCQSGRERQVQPRGGPRYGGFAA